jgi:cell wall-associated NlpC family hydrolase
MKWLIGIVTASTVVIVPGCVTLEPAEGAQFVFAETENSVLSGEASTNTSLETATPLIGLAAMQAQLGETLRAAKLAQNTTKLNNAINKVKKYAGKTWYAFGGSTPRGWDCSGLVKWTYKQVGINLYHSATVQRNSGKKVKTPKVGDLVSFSYGRGYMGHIGIYVGNGKFIHSVKPGVKTTIESVSKFAKNIRAKAVYTRLLKTS